MERAISATDLRRERAAFGRMIVPARGSVLASPSMADWNPEPDYFFHWLRDSAIVMRTVAELATRCAKRGRAPTLDPAFQRFRRLQSGADAHRRCRLSVTDREDAAGFRKFLRPDDAMRALAGDALLGEPRFNPDGSPDALRWSRPQYDGPALRALRACGSSRPAGRRARPCANSCTAISISRAAMPGAACIGPWEEAEENAHHYYVALVQFGALVHGRAFVTAPDAEARLRAVARPALVRGPSGLCRHLAAQGQRAR